MSPRRVLVFTSILGLACGPAIDVEPMASASSDDGDTGMPLTTTTGPIPGSSGAGDTTSGVPPATDTGSTTGGYEDDDGGTGCTFTCPDPIPPGPGPTTGGGFGECDPLAQDCPEGEKCMPWANDGGNTWNSTRCTPLVGDPDGTGMPCTVEGSGTSGIDSCDLAEVCWQVDPLTNVGVCYAMCTDSGDGLWCEDPSMQCISLPANIPLCIQPCDPVAPVCGAGQGCQLADDGGAFYCRPIPTRAAAIGEICTDPHACEAGALCAFGLGIDCGNGVGEGCCAEICDVNAPNPCPGPGVACLPWIPVDPPPELAHIGVCEA